MNSWDYLGHRTEARLPLIHALTECASHRLWACHVPCAIHYAVRRDRYDPSRPTVR